MMHEEVAGGNMGSCIRLYLSSPYGGKGGGGDDGASKGRVSFARPGSVEPMDGVHCQSLHTAPSSGRLLAPPADKPQDITRVP